MYQLCLRREFVAQHYLVGGDWGPENELHSHHYRIEARFGSAQLNEHEYLLDLVDVERRLDQEIERYRDQTLNELQPFADRNPSLEWFATVFARGLAGQIDEPQVDWIEVRLWEDDQAWASFTLEL